MIKVCSLCKAEKSTDEFYWFFDKWTDRKYPSSRCRPCHQKYRRANPNTPKNRKSEKLALRYGLTYEQWTALRESSGFRCMICNISETELGKRLDVDHCHKSGKVRGVLCNPCNNVLGLARDSIPTLTAAIAYLNLNQEGQQS